MSHDVDPGGLEEFSVVFTDRSLNHMSKAFQESMRDISGLLKEVYNADGVPLVPGGGTFCMEGMARQFARNAKRWWCPMAGSLTLEQNFEGWRIAPKTTG